MDASVVIPVKNGGGLFKKVLDSVLNQKTSFEYDVICVDSGSTDGSVEFLKSKPVRLYQIPASEFGHGKTRNFGASKSRAEFVCFITQDALPADEHWLDEMIKAMKTDDNIVGGFGKHLPYPDCNLIDKIDLTNHFNNFGPENRVFYIDDKERYKNDLSYLMYLCFFSDNNSCVRKSVFDKHQYPDVDFAEDQIWMRQMLEKGYKKVYAPKSIVYHSHNFSIIETKYRAYDEFKALWDIFQYKISDSRKNYYKNWLAAVKYDFDSKILGSTMPKNLKIRVLFYSIRKNRAKQIGAYYGYLWHELPSKKKNSLDKKYSQYQQQRSE